MVVTTETERLTGPARARDPEPDTAMWTANHLANQVTGPVVDLGHAMPERPRHQSVAFEIAVELRMHLSARGKVFCPVPAVRLGDTELRPDAAVLLVPVHPRLSPKRINGPPDLVVEVIAEDRDRDEITRRAIYEAAGVVEYWMADPLTNGCTILVMQDGRYVECEHSRILPDVTCFDVGYWIARA